MSIIMTLEHNVQRMSGGAADSGYNRPLYIAGNRPGLSAAAVALTCLMEELIPSCVDGRLSHGATVGRILVPPGFKAPPAFEPDVEATARCLGGGGGGGGSSSYLCHGGITGTSPDSEPVKHNLPVR